MVLEGCGISKGNWELSDSAPEPWSLGGAELFLQVLWVSPLECFLFLQDITVWNFLLISVHWTSSAECLHHTLFTVPRCQEVRGQHGPRFTSGEAALLVQGWSPSQHDLNSKKNEWLSGFSYKGANPNPGCLILWPCHLFKVPVQILILPNPNPNSNILIDG